MGWSLNWLGVRDASVEAILDVLAVEATGEFEEVPESPITGVQLPNGWYVVVENRTCKFANDNLLRQLSSSSLVVTCYIEEHVMHSSAAGWEKRREMWRVSHDCNRGLDHLEVTGEPPDELWAIRDDLVAKQHAAGGDKADVDYVFDAPAELAVALTGFRHDEDLRGLSEKPFEVLKPIRTGLMAKLRAAFGRT